MCNICCMICCAYICIRHETDEILITFYYKMEYSASSVKVNDSVCTLLFYNMYFKLFIMENCKHRRVEKQNNEPLHTHNPASTVILHSS